MFNRLINSRRKDAYEVRQTANEMSNSRPQPDHINNGEEERYQNPEGKLSYIANFSKALLHDLLGEVVPDAYKIMVRAMYSTDPILFERTDMMGTIDGLNLVNPQGGLAFDLEGADPQSVTLKPAPRIDSKEASGEMGELYWMALLRDVKFADYATDLLVAAAANSMSTEFTKFHGPKDPATGSVTDKTLFRGFTPGDLNGPYISQFLLKPIPYGTLMVDQLNKVALANIDYVTDFQTWLNLQNGVSDSDSNSFNDLAENMIPPNKPGSLFEPTPAAPRYICTLRDLTTYVHFCALYEEYLNACLILLNMPARLDPGNPYTDTLIPPDSSTQRTQDGFVTLGPPNIFTLIAEVATRAQKAVWYQKWAVHRRLRPEEFGGRIHVQLAEAIGRYDSILSSAEIINSLTTGDLSLHFPTPNILPLKDSYLLPQAFKEGAPAHPSYGSGHATVAGACVTVLKAWFDESEVFDPGVVPAFILGVPGPVIDQMIINRTPKTTDLGCNLIDYGYTATERRLTVGGELNKLASNIALGRNAAGVHYRSDYVESLKLGEKIAIRFLQEQKLTYNEDFHLSLTRFDGNSVII